MQTSRKSDSSSNSRSSSSQSSASALPEKTKFLKDFKIIDDSLQQKTFHQVHKVMQFEGDEISTWFYKENPYDVPVSEAEAACAGYYKLLAPHHVPLTYAVYDRENEKFVGVLSEEIPGFKPVSQDPLTDDDLKSDYLEKGDLTENIECLEKLDDYYQKIEIKCAALNRKFKKLAYDKTYSKIDTKTLAALEVKYKDEDEQLINEKNKFEEMLQETHFSKSDFKKYRIIKGSAVGLSVRYIFEEDDNHSNNNSKDGKCIDFDMSMWSGFMWRLKVLISTGARLFRMPREEDYQVSTYDIAHFPNLKYAKPFYWPTKGPHYFSNEVGVAVKRRLGFSCNEYLPEVNEVYQKLEKHPVFIYHKFATFTKYILTNSTIYKNITLSRMLQDHKLNSKKLLDIIDEAHDERISQFSRTLIQIPEFEVFFLKHGERISNELMKELDKQGIPFDKETILATCASIPGEIEVAKKKIADECEKLRQMTKVGKVSNMSSSTNEGIDLKPMSDRSVCSDLYKRTKEKVLASMKEYIPSGLLAWDGFFKNNVEEAKQLVAFCKTLSVDSNSKEDNIAATKKLRDYIIKAYQALKVKSGGFHDKLVVLLSEINNALPKEPAQAQAPKLNK